MKNQHEHHHSANAADEAAMAELLDLDAEVLHAYLSDVTAWLKEMTGDRPPRRILDLGSGTGTGTFALLKRFERADATALDISPHMLRHLGHKARDLGVAGRVRAVQADLGVAWPSLGPVDLVWAASSMHHMADPPHVLAEVFKALRPGGLLVVSEMDSFPRFLPDDLGLGRPGLEARVHAARDGGPADAASAHLSPAGFTLEAKRSFVIDLRDPLPAAARRYAQVSLRRVRAHLDGLLDAGDLATLDTLIDGDGPDGVLRRDDLAVRSTRTVWVARRP
ncbi:class I SAM-dependent methyltransferase [Streptosporangium sp. NBC_01495]|uniref:class I SAM-dependent methyltransferase n=1 Tax=Streptosporangium sp. NBC_01495 TaxID=2903899 RepID=UPI002E32649E|nr:methyltransferase domain-containing protein [Streptosporangium sp. NBC_01495]